MSENHLPSEFQEIADGVWAVLTQFSGESFESWVQAGFAPNSGFIVGDQDVLVIDPRMFKRQADEVVEKVAEVAGQPIRHVINTHWHNDHVFGNEGFAGATIIAGRQTFDALHYLAGYDIVRVWADDPLFAPVKDEIAAVNLVLPQIAFEGELVMQMGGHRVELRSLGGGETADVIVAYLPEERILFASDLVLNGAPPYFNDPTVSVNDWIQALDRVVQMAPAVIVPGHGPLADLQTVQAMAEDLRDYRQQVVSLAMHGFGIQEIKARVQLPTYPDYPWYPREALLIGVDIIYKELKR